MTDERTQAPVETQQEHPEEGTAQAPATAPALAGAPAAQEAGDAGSPTANAAAPAAGTPEPAGRQQAGETAQATAAQPSQATAQEAAQAYEKSFARIAPGQIVKARVVQVDPNEVLVDIGYKSEAVIPKEHLSHVPVSDPSQVVHVGDEIYVTILKMEEGESGNVIVSKKRADAVRAWDHLVELKKQGGTLQAVVRERVKGGLLVDVGVRGFVPASHVSADYIEDLDSLVGKQMTFKILELEEDRRNVVLSHKLVEQEEREQARQKLLETLEPGQIVEGEVKRLTSFGAFVDLGYGLEGLLHISEMAYSRVRHPSDILKEGDKIKVMILHVDREARRISLGLKQTLPDPWDTITQKYQVGQIVTGEVTRVVDFGAFVKLEDGIEGLVHISQLAPHRVAKASDVVQPGQQVPVKILNIDTEAHRVSLSIREAMPKEPEGEKPQRPDVGRERHAQADEKASASREEPPQPPANDGSHFSLGDVVNIGRLLEEKEKAGKQ